MPEEAESPWDSSLPKARAHISAQITGSLNGAVDELTTTLKYGGHLTSDLTSRSFYFILHFLVHWILHCWRNNYPSTLDPNSIFLFPKPCISQ